MYKTGDYNNEVMKKHLRHNELNYFDACDRVARTIDFEYDDFRDFFRYFVPSFPILQHVYSNTQTLPFACYTFNVGDSMKDILTKSHIAGDLTKYGGGLGFNVSDIRERGASIRDNGISNGIIPFIKMFEATVLATQQSNARRGSFTVYLDIDHPDIYEFLDLKKKTGGDHNSRFNSPIAHIAVKLTNKFLELVNNPFEERRAFNLISRRDGSVVRTVDARELFSKIVQMRAVHSEPYIMFQDNCDKKARDMGYITQDESISCSNLCTEITISNKTEDGRDLLGICSIGNYNLYECCEKLYNPKFISVLNLKTIEFFEHLYDHASNIIEKQKDLNCGGETYKLLRNAVNSHRHLAVGIFGYNDSINNRNISEPILKEQVCDLLKDLSDRKFSTNFKLMTALAPTETTSKIFTLSKSLEGHKRKFIKHTGQDYVYDQEVVSNKPFVSKVMKGSNSKYIDLVSEINKYVDHAVSLNVYYQNPTFIAGEKTEEAKQTLMQSIAKDIFHAWKGGCSTMYYCSLETSDTEDVQNNPQCEACSA